MFLLSSLSNIYSVIDSASRWICGRLGWSISSRLTGGLVVHVWGSGFLCSFLVKVYFVTLILIFFILTIRKKQI